MKHVLFLIAAGLMIGAGSPVMAQQHDSPSNSLLAQSLQRANPVNAQDKDFHALRRTSQFAVPPPRPRAFAMHDLVQIVVRETTNVKSTQTLDAEKDYALKGKIAKFPDLQLAHLLNLQLAASSIVAAPELDLTASKTFEGDGEYERRDDLTARLTAEVIEVLPNGNLVLEARTRIQTDEEISTMKVTGICRSQDVTALNTVMSNQLHDLSIEKMNEGELKKTTEKGIIAKVLDALFAF